MSSSSLDSTENLVIDVAGINKHFGPKHVVKDLELKVKKGEIFGFLGPNGSGKTTSIRLICGLLTPDNGSGTCLGFDVIKESRRIKRQVGYMTQKFSLWNDLSIQENLDFVARMFAIPDRNNVVSATLRDLGLYGRKKQLAGTLSGGWKQRLSLAACLIHQPKLLLLDEPTAGVDPKARRDFWEHIHQLSESGITILVSTHYMDEAERCHRLAYIAYGNLLTTGTAREIIHQHNIKTWQISGNEIERVIKQLRLLLADEQVTSFGKTIHVSSDKDSTLDQTLAKFAIEYDLQILEIEPSLEDTFMHLIKDYQDPYRE